MKSRLVYILILTLFLFQNAWAMEQTYLVFCESQEISQEVEPHTHDEETTTEHDHSICKNCCHLSSSFVGIAQISLFNDIQPESQYNLFVINKHNSISNKPVTPPPIV